MDHIFVVDGIQSLGGVKAEIEELAEFDVGIEFDESAEGAGAKFEEDVHYFALDSKYEGRGTSWRRFG